MYLKNFLNNIVKKIIFSHPELKNKLKKAQIAKKPKQYVLETIMSSFFLSFGYLVLVYLFLKDAEVLTFLMGIFSSLLFFLFSFFFFFNYVDVLIRQKAREQDTDLLFISEFFLINLESGLPIGIAIQNISFLDRPCSNFFRKIYLDFQTGSDVRMAIVNALTYTASENLKNLLRKIRDSLEVGINLKDVLNNFIEENSEKKLLSVRSYAKKINPLITMYLLLGIVIPSLGLTFFTIGAVLVEMTPNLLIWTLIIIFLCMFIFQYIFYVMFKFGKETL